MQLLNQNNIPSMSSPLTRQSRRTPAASLLLLPAQSIPSHLSQPGTCASDILRFLTRLFLILRAHANLPLVSGPKDERAFRYHKYEVSAAPITTGWYPINSSSTSFGGCAQGATRPMWPGEPFLVSFKANHVSLVATLGYVGAS